MIDNINHILQIADNNAFNKQEDIILPDNYWGEIIYIFFCIKDIIKQPEHGQEKFSNLIRQIKIHQRWMKIK